MKRLLSAVAILAGLPLVLTAADVTVDFARETGVIKDVHGVNNGPIRSRKDQCSGNFEHFKNARIPSARTHDSVYCSGYGRWHTIDITSIFTDFSKDENDPASYDFAWTDYYLKNITDAGAEVYYRLGQSIEHGVKQYYTFPPKDYAKWARICEHIIRHYNEGWANGMHLNIRYWEIWNEPENNPTCWAGTMEQFYDFFEVAAKYLKGKFPNLKIGGPAHTGYGDLPRKTLEVCRKRNIPLDFFSWHGYSNDPRELAARARKVQGWMATNGFEKTESHVTEWNYVRGWGKEWPYTLRVEGYDLIQKGAAYRMAVIMALQDTNVKIAHYYDARPMAMNGLFEPYTMMPMKGYYPFYAWSRLKDYGRQVKADVKAAGKDGKEDLDIYVTAVKGKDGKVAVLVARFNDDDNVYLPKFVTIHPAGGLRFAKDAKMHLTDRTRTYTEVPVDVLEDGSAQVALEPNAFTLIEGTVAK